MGKQAILVIDDSTAMLGEVKLALASAGYEVVTTTQTVGSARHLGHCDLVILDYLMPGIDGGSVLASLRSATEAHGRSVLFYLYTSDAAIAARYRQLGFDGCFTEKGDMQSLVRQVRSAFRLRELMRRRQRPA
jgi:two-component system OmpR family response regulator